MWIAVGCAALLFGHALTFQEALERAPHTPAVQAAARAQSARRVEAEGMGRLTENPSVAVQAGGRNIHEVVHT